MYNNSIAQQDQHSVQVPLLYQEYQAQNQQNNNLSYNQLQVQNDQQNQNNHQNQIINFSNGQEMIEPDFLYCKQSMINKSCNDKRRQVEKLSTLLSQVLTQLPLRFTSIQLIGKTNIYSGLYCEEKIIKPLIAENTHVNEFLIRNGYVVNCSNILCSTIKSQSFIVVAILLSTLLYQSLLDFIYFNNTYSHINSIGKINIVYISQIAITTILLILFLLSTLQFNIKIFYVSYILSIINQLLVSIEVCCNFIIGQEYRDAIFAYLYISFGLLGLLLISCIFIKFIQINQVKLLVLLQKMEQKEFSNL